MKVSASIELLWQMAVQEAIAGEFREIEPEHFLAALLKFSELPVEELDKLAPAANVARELAADVGKVRGELEGRSVDTIRVRRELRGRLGKGGVPFDGGQKHRSQASRGLFDAAARLADDTGSEALAAEHLLEALLASPTAAMQQVLGGAIGPKARASPASETPLLDQCGHDLVQMAAEGRLADVSDRPAECKALLQLLADHKRRSVLAVTESEEAARSVVVAAARVIASGEALPGLKGRRLIDVSASAPEAGKSAEALRLREELLREAATSDQVILMVPPIEAPASPTESSPWADLLKRALGGGSIQCICRVSPAAHERWIKKDHDWKRHVQVMWIREDSTDDIPWEL